MADGSNPSDVRNLFLKLFKSPVPMAPDSPFGIPRDQLVPMLRDADVVIGVVNGAQQICWAHRRLDVEDVINALAEVEGCQVKRVRVPCGCEADLDTLAALTERVKQCALADSVETETAAATNHATSGPSASIEDQHLDDDEDEDNDESHEEPTDEDDAEIEDELEAEQGVDEDGDGFTDDGQVKCAFCGEGDCPEHELARWCPGSSCIDGRLADLTADLRARFADACSEYLHSGQTVSADDCSIPLWDLLEQEVCPETCEAGEPLPMDLVNGYLMGFESFVWMVITRLDVDRGFPGGSDSLWVMFSDPADVTIKQVLEVMEQDIRTLEAAVGARGADTGNNGPTEEGGSDR